MLLCLLILPLVLAFSGVMLVALSHRAGRPPDLALCGKCLYPRAGLDLESPCPECGQTPLELITRPNTAARREADLLLLLGIMALVAMSAVWYWACAVGLPIALWLAVPGLVLVLVMRIARRALLRRAYVRLVVVTLATLMLVCLGMTAVFIVNIIDQRPPDMGIWLLVGFFNPLIVSVMCLIFGAAARIIVAGTPERPVSHEDA